ncbi:hypothetical protein MNB_SV-5-696 [hydrothermal vent metagenome]|uniref:Beta-lactamase n=1 Tax=hydrothermal vent metagenome TaxID=652676 RepID=A0A1W1EE73_9ZZZZ
MNQTKKRLSIINLAISISDTETIQLQILKLSLLQTDKNIQEILLMLKNKNYAQAQGLISKYIETPNKEILQRTFQEEQKRKNREEESIIDEFDLFETNSRKDKKINTLNLDDMLAMENSSHESDMMQEPVQVLDLDDMMEFEKQNIQTQEHETANFDSLLSVSSDEILKDNINIDISHNSSNEFWEEDKEEVVMETQEIQKDTFFDEMPIAQQEATDETTEEVSNETIKKVHKKEKSINVHNDLTELKPTDKNKNEVEVVKYNSITYIDQKFKNMQTQYPIIEDSGKRFKSVESWLLKISNDGYTEGEIEEIIQYIDKIKLDNKEEAAKLLLISAATESKYAQFRLARALYAGEILEKNPAEAFTLINRLAVNDDYPEAICDLAQFYEHGIGIAKDKEKAELLYGEAMNAGIKRATDHYTRLKKQNKSFFSFLTK